MSAFGIFFKLSQITIAKAIFIFHQVSKQISFKKLDRLLYGTVCIFLSSKLDDLPKPLKEIVKAFDYFSLVYRDELKKN